MRFVILILGLFWTTGGGRASRIDSHWCRLTAGRPLIAKRLNILINLDPKLLTRPTLRRTKAVALHNTNVQNQPQIQHEVSSRPQPDRRWSRNHDALTMLWPFPRSMPFAPSLIRLWFPRWCNFSCSSVIPLVRIDLVKNLETNSAKLLCIADVCLCEPLESDSICRTQYVFP